MKIGIDAKWLFSGNISGKLFIQNVLPELFALYPEIEWHIFLNKKERQFEVPYKNENIKVHYVWAKIKMLSDLFILPRHARRLKLEAVLFQTFSPKSNSFKSILFTHDLLFKTHPQFFTWKEKIYFFPLKWTIGFADRIITTTEFVKQELLKFHYAKKNQPIDIAPSGVTNIFKPLSQHDPNFIKKISERYNLPDSFLLFTGRLNLRKNIQGIIKAMSLLSDKNIMLVIVGPYDRKMPRLNRLLSNKETIERVLFLGPVSDEELAAIYAMAKIFCFPSFAEGFGLPPLEAMASAIPAVVSNTTAMPEVCGNAAIFIDPHNPKKIAEKINDLLENKSFYDQKVKEGLEWSKQYTWRMTAEKIANSIIDAVRKAGDQNSE